MATDEVTMKRIAAGCVVGLPWLFVAFTLLVSPNYLIPFLKLPVGMAIMFVSAVISGLGWWVLQQTSNKLVWAGIILFLVMPQFVTPMFGPAIVTILQALGPVMGSGSDK